MKRLGITAAVIFLLAAVIGVRHRTFSRDDLFTLRVVVDNYTYDKGDPPRSLHDVVSAGYLHRIPAGISIEDVK